MISAGILPLRRLFWRSKRISLLQFPNSCGTGPVSLFNDKRRFPRMLSAPSSCGMGPENLLPDRSSIVRLSHEPNTLGILPSNWLPLKS
uniref:Uncharacterized protein n=1 Tax=Arundo donax TaxID=35708 RepID=A0A0A9FSR6_ARUDO